ncbi:MAG: ABC-2 family transporter protein, partial [Candidatus Eremiobacteraeota bacterium]|nr:ABC-2 family transporter protein [Candidatus Eremiobacteraeota bacterium]
GIVQEVTAQVRVDTAFLVFVPLVVVGGALIDLGISLAVATISFWFIRVDTLRWVVMSLEQEFTRYPISIYTRGVRLILTFVLPFAFMNYFPATYFLHKAETALYLAPQVGLLTPAIGLAWLALSYVFWRFGLQHYQGTGS